MIRKKLCQLYASIWLILLLGACTPEPTVEQVTVVPRTPVNTPATVSLPTITAVLPTSFPTIVPSSISPTATKVPATAVPTPAPAINLDGITKFAQWGRGEVYDIAYSSDGRYLYIMSASGTYIHDLQDPNGIQQRFESDLPVVLSPDGETAVIGQEVRRLSNNSLLFTVPVGSDQNMFFLNDSLLAVKNWVQGEGNSIELWNIPDGQLIHTFDQTNQLALSPDGKLMVTVGSHDPSFVVYEWPELTELSRISPELNEDGLVRALPLNAAFSPESQMLALAWEGYESWNTAENSIDILDLQTGEVLLEIPSIEAWGYKEDITFSCDEPPFMFEGPGAPRPIEVMFSPDKQFVAVVYNDDFSASDKVKRRVNIYQVSDGALVLSANDGDHVAFPPDGQMVAISTVLGDVQVWNMADFSLAHDIAGYTGSVRRIQFSPDNQFAAIEQFDGTRLQRVSDGTVVAEYSDGRITFAPDGETLAVGYGDGQIEWRQIADNRLLNSFSGHTARVNDLVFLPSGDLVSVADDCTMVTWNIADGTRKLQFEDYLRPSERNSDEQIRIKLNHLLVLPSGNLVAGSSGYEVSLWQTEDGALAETLRRTSSSDLFTLPDGEKINRLRDAPYMPLNFWETTNDDLLPLLDGKTIFSFSPNGLIFVVGSYYGETQLWDAQAGVALGTLPSPDQRKVTAVQFSPDGRYLLVGSAGGIVTVWEMPLQ